VVAHPRWVGACVAAGHCLATEPYPLDDVAERARERDAADAASVAAADVMLELCARGGWASVGARAELPESDGLAGCVVALVCRSQADDKLALLQVRGLRS
jgi:hypothetical protein